MNIFGSVEGKFLDFEDEMEGGKERKRKRKKSVIVVASRDLLDGCSI